MVRDVINTRKNYIIRGDNPNENRKKSQKLKQLECLIDMEDKDNLSITDVVEEENPKFKEKFYSKI